MKQVAIDSGGAVHVVDVPAPVAEQGLVLVKTVCSVISAGTESATVASQSAGLLSRARPDIIARVWQQARVAGPSSALDLVSGTLRRLSPLGYSLAGRVVDVGSGVDDLKVGDAVACSGALHAYHAEIVSVPRRLAAAVPDGVSLRDAAFTGLGAIALQAVRRSRAAIGETAVVIGLGLLGQLTVLLLRASGCRVIAVDPSAARLEAAVGLGAAAAFASGGADAQRSVQRLTAGLGADAVLLCAATPSSEPINQAFALAREAGRVVIVGDVGMELERPEFYRKELDVVMSRSLGPGRYDPAYETHGVDYPAAYVRWTENRNMDAFLSLLRAGSVGLGPLVAGEFPVEQAADAYAALRDRQSGAVAIILNYAPGDESEIRRRMPAGAPRVRTEGQIRVAVIGPGGFSKAIHIPRLRRHSLIALRAICARDGLAATSLARQSRAEYVTTSPAEIFADPEVDCVFVTTRHDSHARLTLDALAAGKHVFVEKPLALDAGEAWQIHEASQEASRVVVVGFNRRFAPGSSAVRRHFSDVAGPKEIVYRVRADYLPNGHWLDDPLIGGGRIAGEACHAFDWMSWFVGQVPEAIAAARAPGLQERLTATLMFPDGSVGTLIYTTDGAAGLPKERIEVHGGGRSAVLDDFASVILAGPGAAVVTRRAHGKGYDEQLDAFVQALRGERTESGVAFDGWVAARCAEAADAALVSGRRETIRPAGPPLRDA